VTPERWQRIKEIFQSAAEHAPGDRDAYLTTATGGDAELRREVEKMLQYATGIGFLDRPAWEGLRFETELQPGTHLGPYQILQAVGAGGMGRVYKARDTRLERTVAIKVLSAEYSHRLRIEGRAISALNHPNVCALYDIGDQDGAAYLVMEYVEGESLAECLTRGPLPLAAVLRYGAEIASALAAAHAQDIVHRDLKPANIMITASGAKVLDFGVARIARDDEPVSESVVGTAAYMSPSQLNGSPADTRSDIFALGLVLCEMVTGTRPSRESPKALQNVPAALANLIGRCLEQDAARRVQQMSEVQVTLERLRSEITTRRRTNPRWIAAAVLAMAAAGVLTWRGTTSRPRPEARRAPPPAASPAASAAAPVVPPTRMEQQTPVVQAPAPIAHRTPLVQRAPLAPPSLVTLTSYPGMERDPSFSPDGSKIAFSWHSGDRRGYGIYVRPVKEEQVPTELTEGSAEDWGPAWSPDGRKIAFRRKGRESGIYSVDSSGGSEVFLAPIAKLNQETLPQISWSHDGNWIATPDRSDSGSTQIYLVSTKTGEKRQITFNTGGIDHAPIFSPDGKSLAYASCERSVYPCDIFVVDFGRNLAPKGQRRITDEGMYIRGIAWLPDGHNLVYSAGPRSSAGTSLWRVSVDPPGIPMRIDMAGSSARHPAISTDGGLLAYTRLGSWSLMMIRNFR
jgi:serine/threonine protein kinase